MFPTTIFLFTYGIFSSLYKNHSYKTMFLNFLCFAGMYIVGLLLSGVLLIPAINVTLGSPRIGSVESQGLLWDKQVYIGLIINWISYYPLVDNIFMSGANGHASGYSLFIGFLPLVLGLSNLFGKNKKLYKIILLVIGFFITFKPLSSVMHGFSEPSLRWTFLIVFMVLLLAAIALDNNNTIEIKKSFKYCSIVIIFGWFACFLYFLSNNSYFNHFLAISIIVAISIAIGALYFKNDKLSIVLSVVLLVFVNVCNINFRASGNRFYTETINRELMESYIKSDEELIFRYYIDNKHLNPGGVLNLNKSIDSGYMGTMTYNTFYDSKIVPYLRLNNINWHIIKLDMLNQHNMLGVKYYVVYDESELPKDGKFEYAYNLDHLKVYKNLEYTGFGYSVENIKSLSEMRIDSDFKKTLYCNLDELQLGDSLIEKGKWTIIEKGNNYLKGNYDGTSDNILFIPIPNNKGWKVYVNGELTNPIDVNGGFMGIPVKAGNNNIELYFMSYGLKAGIISSLVGLIFLGLLLIYNRKNNIL